MRNLKLTEELERWVKLLPIIQAFVNGRVIQLQNSYDMWEDMDERYSFNFSYSHERYRVKPEPRTFWLRGERVFTDKATADAYNHYAVHPIIEVREVLS